MPVIIKDEILKDIVNIYGKSSNPQIINRLLGGMSHYTYLVKINDSYYTYRKIGPAGDLYVNREEELYNINQIDNLNISNKTIYFNTLTGVKISKYIKGTDLTQTDYIYYLDKISNTLKTLHNSNLKAKNDFNYLNTLNRYESYNNTQDEMYLYLKDKWFLIYNKHYKDIKKVFCHNDAQRSNMVIGDDDKLYLLDFEYAHNNDIYYDIASFGNVNFNDSIKLLENYLNQKPSIKDINRVKFYRMYQALMWHQVAKYKNDIGLSKNLKIDFLYHQNNYLKLAQNLYEEIKDK